MRLARARVFTVPPSAPFLPTLIRALVDGRLLPGFPDPADPLSLASATIYLPTQRACRLAHELFLDVIAQDAAVLPRLIPLGEMDQDELAFADAAAPFASGGLEPARAIEPMDRKLLLAQLILQWARLPQVQNADAAPLVAATPAAALALAEALARLIDDMITREVPWERLDQLVPDHLDPYWQITLQFLQVARKAWPDVLQAHERVEPAALRDRLIAAEQARLEASTAGPVIAAGSTASMPATARLLETIARLPHGAVVLPGLDTSLDDPSWGLIAESRDRDGLLPAVTHPQFAMHGFLAQLGMHREEVVALVETSKARERLVSEALRPAAATERWSERLPPATVADALHGVSLIEAANAEEEALAIAVALREPLEMEGANAALVTPDRGLARRVIAALARWNIRADDSAGEALADTPAGVFARLVADAVLGGLQPVPLLALLKHPLLRLYEDAAAQTRAVFILERALLRGPRPLPGVAGLRRATASFRETQRNLHPRDPRRHLDSFALRDAAELVERIGAAIAPLKMTAESFGAISKQHREVLIALGGGEDTLSGNPEHGAEDLLRAFDEIEDSVAAQTLQIRPAEYLETFESVIADRVRQRPALVTARVGIYGLLEARLQHVDRIVLGSLVEGTWPPQTRSDPWLSRPMRRELGLDLPERRIGLSAHDFAQALGAREVVLSRADKIAGAPTVPSRFLQRLAAVSGEHWSRVRAGGRRYVELARSLDHAETPHPIAAPEPKPPREARPLRLTITEIEDWTRDPYTIYARHVLRLAPLDDVDSPIGARDRGTAIHAAIEEFTRRFADALPDNPAGELLAIGRKYFEPLAAFPEALAFWWPRFERIAAWFAEWEIERRSGIAAIHTESRGEIELPLGERVLKLAGRADRIERRSDGSYVLLDYKTGKAPTAKQVLEGFSPQLTLEGAILRAGGFKDIPAGGSVAALAYVQLRGGDPPGEECEVRPKSGRFDPDAEADKALQKLRYLATRFEDENEPYRALIHSTSRKHYGDYDHLARVKEWSATRDELDAGPRS